MYLVSVRIGISVFGILQGRRQAINGFEIPTAKICITLTLFISHIRKYQDLNPDSKKYLDLNFK